MSTLSTEALRDFGTAILKAIPAKDGRRMKKVMVSYKIENDLLIPVVDIEFFNPTFTHEPYGD